MKPILYAHDETSFTSAGLAILADCISCTVEEEINGTYECEFEYPITGRHYDLIQEGLIIGATHDDSGRLQPFDIYKRSAPIDGKVTFNAHHISYRLSKTVVMPFVGTSLVETINELNSNIVGDCPFLIAVTGGSVAPIGGYQNIKPNTVRTLLLGEENPIVKAYSGYEAEFDNFFVFLSDRRGTDTNVEIRYGKNLKDIEQERDMSGSYNAVVPFWISSDGATSVYLPEKYVSHDGATELRMKPLDLSSSFKEKPSVSELRQKATDKLESSRAWNPSESITVDFVALWQTDEYEQYAELQRVHIGDSVSVYYPALGVIANGQRVVKTVYNTLLDRYDEITLNELRSTLADLSDQSIVAGVNTAISDAVKISIDSIKSSKSGIVTTDINGVANIETLISGIPVNGTVAGFDAYVIIGNAFDGSRTARFTNMDGTPIAEASLTVTINCIM